MPFDHVITAQQVGAYKPSASMFEAALSRIGEPREHVVHVAQSLFHDIVPASPRRCRVESAKFSFSLLNTNFTKRISLWFQPAAGLGVSGAL